MRLKWAIRALAVLGAMALTITIANADENTTRFVAKMSGFHEVPPILSQGTGTFRATVQGTTLTYTETFSGLTNVTQSHIHFGEPGVNGGVFLFLCTNLNNGPAGTPACPTSAGTVTRTVTAADIVGPFAQHVSPGDFAGALRILESGDAYVNIHTVAFPAGEIRGQVSEADD